jgi:hypothetical protein
MTIRRWCLALCGLAAFAALAGTQLPVFAQGDEKVEWKAFDKKVNPVFYQTLNTKTVQNMKVMGQELKQEQKQTFYIQWTPLDKDAKGNWVVEQQIIGVEMDIDIGGNKIAYKSTDKGQGQNPLSDFFRKLMDLKLKFTVSSDLKVENIEGRKEFVEQLTKVSPQMGPLLDKILSEKALIAMAEPTWAAFPPGGVFSKKGWEKKSELDLGPIGSYSTTFNYSYEGKDKIAVTSNLTYTKPAAAGGLPFTIKDAKLSSKDGKGEITFNRDKGRIEKSNMKMNLDGSLTIEVGGMATEVSLNQTQEATVTTSDTNPVKELEKQK